jgi:hypothetical protein
MCANCQAARGPYLVMTRARMRAGLVLRDSRVGDGSGVATGDAVGG